MQILAQFRIITPERLINVERSKFITERQIFIGLSNFICTLLKGLDKRTVNYHHANYDHCVDGCIKNSITF